MLVSDQHAWDGSPFMPRSRTLAVLDSLRGIGAAEQATALADRAATRAPLNDPGCVARLLDSLRKAARTGISPY